MMYQMSCKKDYETDQQNFEKSLYLLPSYYRSPESTCIYVYAFVYTFILNIAAFHVCGYCEWPERYIYVLSLFI